MTRIHHRGTENTVESALIWASTNDEAELVRETAKEMLRRAAESR